MTFGAQGVNHLLYSLFKYLFFLICCLLSYVKIGFNRAIACERKEKRFCICSYEGKWCHESCANNVRKKWYIKYLHNSVSRGQAAIFLCGCSRSQPGDVHTSVSFPERLVSAPFDIEPIATFDKKKIIEKIKKPLTMLKMYWAYSNYKTWCSLSGTV